MSKNISVKKKASISLAGIVAALEILSSFIELVTDAGDLILNSLDNDSSVEFEIETKDGMVTTSNVIETVIKDQNENIHNCYMYLDESSIIDDTENSNLYRSITDPNLCYFQLINNDEITGEEVYNEISGEIYKIVSSDDVLEFAFSLEQITDMEQNNCDDEQRLILEKKE